jgi:hypothetical protein
MYAAIADWAAEKQYSITFMCAQLGLARSGYLLPLADRGAMPASEHRRRVDRGDPRDPHRARR